MQDLTVPRRGLPAVAVLVWLAFVAWATWEHVQASGQPLIHDAITYWVKAKNLWASVAHGQWVSPLDVEPTTRPPGTVLMSYPFGFEESPKGFLFRSVFLGIALTALAVFLVACALPRIGTRAWDVACVALFLSALPMHFHFEWSSTSNSPGGWGLTDCFLAGVAALAASAATLGAVRRSWGWTALAALLSGLCFLTKPAGALIVVAVTCAWFVIVLALGFVARGGPESRVPDWRTLGMGAIVFGAVCGSVLLAGFESRYFSAENLAYGDRVLKVMRGATVDSSQLHTMIHTSFGYPFIIAFATAVVAGIEGLRSRAKAPTGEERALAVGGLLAGFGYLAAGFWFWFIKTGGTQVRYFYPFLLMAAISIMPLAFLALHGVTRQSRFVVRAFLLLPPLGVALLLAHPDPPGAWQRLAGVNLAAQPASPDVVLGRRALDAVRQDGRGVTLYAANSGDNVAIESLWLFEDVAHPELPNIRIKRSFDWERTEATFLLAGIGEASFILSPYVREAAERKRALAARSVDSYVAEQRLFEAWFSGLGAKGGVEVFGETANLRLLRVVDQERFGRALEDLRRSRQWRPEFLAANPHTWWSREELSALLAGRHVAASGVGFDGLFRVEALTLQREGELGLALIDFWWSEEKKPPPGEWFFFAHTVDGGGAILGNVPVRLEYRVPHARERPLRLDSLTVPLAASGAAKAIAFGIFRLESGQAHPLVADSGNRDWDNHRVVVPLP